MSNFRSRPKPSSAPTSWDRSGPWYDKIVSERGHHFHQSLLIPKTLNWLQESGPAKSLVDLGCGQGVLARALDKDLPYLGIDASQTLLKKAQRQSKSPKQRFARADLSSRETSIKKERADFSHAVMLLSLQNMADGQMALINARRLLKSKGHLLLILNHPCFRIPRQSSWKMDEQQMVQSRCINAYLSPLAIPIVTNPGRSEQLAEEPKSVVSFHQPLSTLTQWLCASGFFIAKIDEWISEKVSEGKFARAENRARREIPLFLALHAIADRSPHESLPTLTP